MTKASNFIYISDVQEFLLSSVTLKLSDGIIEAKNKTSGVVISDVKTLTILNSHFENLIGYSSLGGGAL